MLKRFLSLFLVFVLLVSIMPTAFGAGAEHLIIFQVYGGGGKSDTPVTHSFLELYNPTNTAVDLNGWSVQYASNRGGTHLGNTNNAWVVRALSGSIPAKHSLLIRGAAETTTPALTKFAVNAYDLDFPDWFIDNKQYRIALVSSTTALTSENGNSPSVVDFVSVKDGASTAEPVGEGGTSVVGISKQISVRRLSSADTDNNANDFTLTDYRTSDIGTVFPRSLATGSWTPPLPFTVPSQPIFSVSGGLYAEEFDLSITCENDASIYYTVDGSLPFSDGELTASAILYSNPLHIAHMEEPYDAGDLSMIKNISSSAAWNDPQGNLFKGTVIKAVAVKEVSGQKYASSVVVNSYFVSEDIFEKYNLPVISIAMDKDDLFSDAKGIYRNYTQSGSDWERPGYMEFYEPNGQLGFKRGMGVRLHGGNSKTYQQKSLRFYFKSKYDESGEDKVVYPIIPSNKKQSDHTTPVTEYKRFVLRSSSNDLNAAMFRDALAHKINGGLDAYGSAYRPAIAFVNGEFWGLYNIREHYHADYLETHMGVDESKNGLMFMEYDTNKVPVADVLGDERNYVEFLIRLGCQSYADLPEYADIYNETNGNVPDINDPSIYDYVKENISVDNFIDYNIAHIFFANTDWPFNNVKMWRVKNPTGSIPSTWQFMMHDLDFGMGLINANFETDMIGYALGKYRMEYSPGFYYNPDWGTFLFERLMENDDFKARFINRLVTLTATYYASSRTLPLVEECKAAIYDAVIEQRKRNVAIINGAATPYSDDEIMNKWINDVVVVTDFLTKRPTYINNHIKSNFGLENAEVTLKANQVEGFVRIGRVDIKEGAPGIANPSSFTAKYFRNVPIEINAVPKEGYAFSRFEVRDGGRTRIYNTQTATITPTSDKIEVKACFVKDSPTSYQENIVAAGSSGVLAVMENGALYTYTEGASQKIMEGVSKVWASGDYSFAKKNDNQFYAWGKNIPTPWAIGNDILTACGGNQIAYIKSDKNAYLLGESQPFAKNVDKISAYGDNYYYISNGIAYQKGSESILKAGALDIAANKDGIYILGNDHILYQNSMPILQDVTRFSLGEGHLLAQTSGGELYGMGDNASRQLEDSDTENIPEFKLIGKNLTCFDAGGIYSVLSDDLGITILGGGGYPSTITQEEKRPPLNLLAAGENHITYTLGGRVYSWGGNDMAQLGDNSRTNRSGKRELYMLGTGNSLANASGIAAGDKQGLAITADGKLIGWGNGANYNLTRGSNMSFVDGAVIAENVAFAVSGKNHTMYISNNYVLYGAGSNDKKKLGLSASGDVSKFTEIMSNVISAGAGESHSVALALDGTLYGFGDNTYGQLGPGNSQIDMPSPIMTEVAMAWASGNMTLVLKEDGSLWGMGSAANGQFGTTAATTGATPIHIADNVKTAALSNTHIMVVLKDGSLWTAGSNSNGEMGIGTSDGLLHPLTKVFDHAAYIAAGNEFSAVMTENGAVYTWGRNSLGQLGCGNMNATLERKNPITAGTQSFSAYYADNSQSQISLLKEPYVMAKIQAVSNYAAPNNIQATIAVYSSSQTLLSIHTESLSVEANGVSDLTLTSFIHQKNAATVKILLWDSFENMQELIVVPPLQIESISS